MLISHASAATVALRRSNVLTAAILGVGLAQSDQYEWFMASL